MLPLMEANDVFLDFVLMPKLQLSFKVVRTFELNIC